MTNSKRDEDRGLTSLDDRNHPEQYPTEQPSLFDLHESEMHVDPIPVEDLKFEVQEERDKETTKHRSSSEGKYNTGFEDEA
ncbi:hypothetical protein D3C77_622880 [compost metagenome]